MNNITTLLPLLGRVALGAQRPIVVKLSGERSVGLSVSVRVRVSVGAVQCIVEKRRIGWHHRSDWSMDEAGSGVWRSVHTFGEEFGVQYCI